jgi:hypothetical protein
LDDVLLERQSLLQEAASSTLKVKRERKSERTREKLKHLLRERKISCVRPILDGPAGFTRPVYRAFDM